MLTRKGGNAVYVIGCWHSMPGAASYVLKGNLFGRMPISDVNLKATVRVNEKRGKSFRVVREDAQRVIGHQLFNVAGDSELHDEGGDG